MTSNNCWCFFFHAYLLLSKGKDLTVQLTQCILASSLSSRETLKKKGKIANVFYMEILQGDSFFWGGGGGGGDVSIIVIIDYSIQVILYPVFCFSTHTSRSLILLFF